MSVQLIHIGPNTPLTQVAIQYALQRAASNYMYAKFYTDTYFIQVNFMKDNSINVTSNIRTPQFVNALWKAEQTGWTLPKVKAFVYQWMQLNRRILK